MSRGYETGLTRMAADDLDQLEVFMSPAFDWERLSTVQLMDLRISEMARTHPQLHLRVRDVLATREHIPTKAERKAARQALAKEQRTR
jgi:hypothetical protein